MPSGPLVKKSSGRCAQHANRNDEAVLDLSLRIVRETQMGARVVARHRILLIGIDPDSMDYSQPGTPPGLNAMTAKEGRNSVVALFKQQGDRCDVCELQPNRNPLTALKPVFADATYDCVLIGGGLRVPQPSLPLFEAVIDAIRQYAPRTSIAFNTSPEDCVAAVARRIG